ncbi:MAG: response regulator [Candidatus Schekmanbacteria bacterium]|nr:response regulator [Candidatus Schekmanbacteria bacterium]
MKILIVDDNSDDRELLRLIIERHGHQVIEACNGQEGLSIAAKQKPNIIISDALMPVMDGFQFLRNTKKDKTLNSIPFIFYSATYKEYQDAELALSLGADAFIIKPKDPAELWKEIEDILKENKSEKPVTAQLIEEDEEYLKRYSEIVAIKLEEKIRELEGEIAARRKTEELIKKSEKKLLDITSSLGEGIYVFDLQGLITFMNPMAERLIGWTMDELNEKGAHNLIHYRKADGTPLPLEECPMHNITKTGNHYISKDEVFIRKDGTVLPISVISTPIIEEGKIIASVTAFRDFTDRRRLEEEREKLILELQDALAKVKTLSGMLPICSSCKKIRDDKGYWNQIESYISENSDVLFSHSLCPDCAEKMLEEIKQMKLKNHPEK